MIRFYTDVNFIGPDLLTRELTREKIAMRALGISLCLAFTAWMAGAGTLAYFSKEIAEFIVSRGWL